MLYQLSYGLFDTVKGASGIAEGWNPIKGFFIKFGLS